MPLSKEDASVIVKRTFFDCKIQASIQYRNMYIFRIDFERPFEEDMDPFVSVDIETGDCKDFSIIHGGNITEIIQLFQKTGPS